MKSIIASIAIFLVAASQLVSSSPIQIARASLTKDSELIAFSPSITSPKGSGNVWNAGTMQNMTWKTDNIPWELKNSTGKVLLGWLDQEYPYNEHLDTENPLCEDFLLTDGITSFTVDSWRIPETRNSYILCLMGDSGNISDQLKIVSTQDQAPDNSDNDGDNGDNSNNDESDSALEL